MLLIINRGNVLQNTIFNDRGNTEVKTVNKYENCGKSSILCDILIKFCIPTDIDNV